MAGDRDADEETRNIMMQNLFGDQSEEEEEEEEIDSEHEAAANQSDYPSEDVEADAEIEVDVDGEQEGGEQEGEELEAEADGEYEGEADGEDAVEGQGEVEVESELEAHDIDVEQVESEGSPEREVSDERARSEGKYAESEEEGYGQRTATSRRREVYAIESEGSEENHFSQPHNEDEEVGNTRNIRSTDEQKDNEVVRDVFGESDEDEGEEYGIQNDLEQDSHRSTMEEEEIYEKDLKPEDMVPDEDAQFEFEDENLDQKTKEKPIGPPLEINIPLHPPPGRPDQMNMIRVSNIMGIEQKPFDPATHVEEDAFVTDESGMKKRIRLEDNIVRWRTIKNRDGTTNYESNARFVQWSDGSLQLLIGNEVLDISVQEADHDQSHLFLRHAKGILQSQGRLLRKMRFMPSSLSSKSHRLLTAIVDSRHKKVYKVKNCVTDIDPEREKEEKRKIEGQTIRANEQLSRKREKVNRKYSQPVNRGRQLSPGFLEDALDEEDEHEGYSSSRRSTVRRRFEDDFEAEAEAEKRISNAKRKSTPRKPPLSAVRSSKRLVEDYSESEREESEYESDGEDIETSPGLKAKELDYEDDYEEEADEEAAGTNSASEEEDPRGNARESRGNSLKRKEIDSDVDSPPRKASMHRRKAVVFDSDDE
ncbi:protein LEO1 homolog isoform X2 [Phalaenopsis equestris]|uniref:protein LEO1 homolog isoform X2 n=1 Tax=Phalaenopsis equestris TaxID=78828 RepID=UPI0009E21FC3|nr:protein LEO1 homolog isoform X2 [Phalaenopsis equestris]